MKDYNTDYEIWEYNMMLNEEEYSKEVSLMSMEDRYFLDVTHSHMVSDFIREKQQELDAVKDKLWDEFTISSLAR
tara:strand:+ start:19179 stop:19403 length:225 start_codon:yes stop_codon:yes gene_type:complete